VSEAEDAQKLQELGYAQELLRRMGSFQNFAISFSIICILAGGITSFQVGFCAIGGAAIGIGWPLSCAMSLLLAATMGQVASAYPTAGGLYHWASILGGRGWGWLTAWLNLAGLVTVLAAINVGVYLFVAGSVGALAGIHVQAMPAPIPYWAQTLAVLLITVSQAAFNHLGIRLTSMLTDFSGYLILAVSVVLTGALLFSAPTWEVSRLVTFTNYSGSGEVWPAAQNLVYLFVLSLLLPAYTVTGFDASAHTAEETVDAARNVPAGMVRSVLCSGVLGWVMLSAVVLAMPDPSAAAASGADAVFHTMQAVLSRPLLIGLLAGIAVAQYLCGLATVTSASRMVYAFARDGGLPASGWLRKVSPRFQTPAVAIWVVALLCVLFALNTKLYTTMAAVAVIFLYLSYVLPVALGMFAYQRSWTEMGPWTMGVWYRPAAAVCIVFCSAIFYAGFQPPNEGAVSVVLGTLVLAALVWFGFERRRFPGPPAGLVKR
jgi:amino acid transporter